MTVTQYKALNRYQINFTKLFKMQLQLFKNYYNSGIYNMQLRIFFFKSIKEMPS